MIFKFSNMSYQIKNMDNIYNKYINNFVSIQFKIGFLTWNKIVI